MSEPAAASGAQSGQASSPPRGRLREVALLFTRLGFTAFGGPAAHVAIIEDEVVERRRWIDRAHFLDAVAAVNFIPGPDSTELAIHLGQLRAGFAGLVVAGVCFIAPAVLIILPIAWAYVRWGALPQVQPILGAIGAAIVAIVVVATFRFLRSAIKDSFAIAMCVIAIVGAMALHRFTPLQPEVIVLGFAASCGAIGYGGGLMRRGSLRSIVPVHLLVGAFRLDHDVVRMTLFFLKVGATLFGSGYVLVSYLQSGIVDDYGWMTQQQLLDAIAVGQFTPGPLLTTATFVGYFLGHATFGGGIGGGLIGGILATVAIFLPSFVFVALFGPLLGRLRQNRIARGALDAMNAAVVGLMLLVALRLGLAALFHGSIRRPQWLHVLIFAAALLALLRGINATWIVLAAGVIGSVAWLAH